MVGGEGERACACVCVCVCVHAHAHSRIVTPRDDSKECVCQGIGDPGVVCAREHAFIWAASRPEDKQGADGKFQRSIPNWPTASQHYPPVRQASKFLCLPSPLWRCSPSLTSSQEASFDSPTSPSRLEWELLWHSHPASPLSCLGPKLCVLTGVTSQSRGGNCSFLHPEPSSDLSQRRR